MSTVTAWCLNKSPTRLFIQQLVQTNNKENIESLHDVPSLFVRKVTGDSPHKDQ